MLSKILKENSGPILARVGTKKIPTLIPTNYKFIDGKYSPTNFKKGVTYVPVYKRLKIFGITSI